MIYLTRDRDWTGKVVNLVDIWEIKPVRFAHEGDDGVEWLHADGNSIDGHLNFLPLDQCMEKYGTIPDNSNMMIKVGEHE